MVPSVEWNGAGSKKNLQDVGNNEGAGIADGNGRSAQSRESET
jgi:hypothetical protein